MKRFYFNTGVTIVAPAEGQVRRGGTNQITFEVSDDIPDNAELMFLCSNPNLRESEYKNVIVTPVFNTTMCSQYAYFKII